MKLKMYKVRRAWKRFRHGVQNLITWFPIIWKDKQWDHDFMEQILIKKLTLMADYFEEGNTICKDAHLYAQKIRTVVRLLEKYSENYYEMEYTQYFKQDFHIDKNGQVHLLPVEYDNLGQYFDKYPRIFKEVASQVKDHNEEDAREIIASLMASRNEQRCLQLAYKMIAYYSPRWWD